MTGGLLYDAVLYSIIDLVLFDKPPPAVSKKFTLIIKNILHTSKTDLLLLISIRSFKLEQIIHIHQKYKNNINRPVFSRAAAVAGDLNVIKYFIKNGVDFRQNNNDALSAAINNGHLHIVKYLMRECGAKINEDNINLRKLIKNECNDMVIFLHQNGVNISDELIECVFSNNIIIFKYVLKVYEYSKTFISRTIAAAAYKMNDSFIYVIEEKISNFSECCDEGINEAASINNYEMMEYLYNKRCGPPVEYKNGIYNACLMGYLDIVKFLHKRGTSITFNNNICLSGAKNHKKRDIVKYLLKNGAQWPGKK